MTQILKSELKYLQMFATLDTNLLTNDNSKGFQFVALLKMFILNAIMTILGHSLYGKFALMTERCFLFKIK